MCVKHAGVHYQHFASDSSRGGGWVGGGEIRRKSIFCTFGPIVLPSFGKKNSLCGNCSSVYPLM